MKKGLHNSGSKPPHDGLSGIGLLRPIVVIAPFLGYLSAYLVELGEAGYYRIPSAFVAVGIEDALMSGAVLIVISAAAFFIWNYFRVYSVWRLHIPRKGNHLLENVRSDRPTWRWPFSKLFFFILLIISITLLLACIVFVTTSLLGIAEMSGGDLRGRDRYLVMFFTIGLLYLIAANAYIFKSKSGQEYKDEPIIESSIELQYKHILAGALIALFIGAFCYFGGYEIASEEQFYLVDRDSNTLIVRNYANGNMVVARFVDQSNTNEKTLILEGDYFLCSLPEGANEYAYPESTANLNNTDMGANQDIKTGIAGYRWELARLAVHRGSDDAVNANGFGGIDDR